MKKISPIVLRYTSLRVILKFVFVVCILVSDYTVVLALSSDTLGPISDAYVRRGTFASVNFGSDTSLVVKSSATSDLNRSSYLKFSLNTLANIGSAKIRIYGRNTFDATTVTISAYSIDNDSWTESTITFNNAPSSSSPVLNSVNINDQAKYYEIDVTDYVKSQFAGDKIVSFLLQDATNQNKNNAFNSKENSINFPQLVVTGVTPEIPLTVLPQADAFVRNGTYGGNNYGNDTALIIKSTTSAGFTRSSYLKFPLGSATNIGTAKLRLYGRNTENTSGIIISVYSVDNDSWSESTITFNNAPTSSAALNSGVVTDQAKYYEFDVTNYVKAQFAGDKMVSFLVRDASNQNKTITFNSKENSQNPPQLLIGTANEPTVPGTIAVSPSKIYDNDVSGGTPGLNRVITINNTGQGNLFVSGISLTGSNTDQFVLSGLPALPITINPASSVAFIIKFNPSSTGLKTAAVKIDSDDPLNSSVLVPVRGLGTVATGGTGSPSLQSILDLLEIPVNVGDDDASTAVIHSSTTLQKAALLGEEVSIQKFEKAGAGNVTIEPLAVFGPNSNPVLGMGWYNSGDTASKKELFTVSNPPASNAYTVNVNIAGTLSFDPLTASFGLYSRWPFYSNRQIYSEDHLNTHPENLPHHVRVYPYKTQSGVVPNAYIIAVEEASGCEYQDVAFVVKNVKPASETPFVSLLPQADAFVRNGTYAAKNYGSDTSLVIKGSTSAGLNRSSYLKFLLGSATNVGSAKLRLYGRNTENTSNIITSVYSVDNDSWTESAIIFNNAPTSSVSALSSGGVNDQAKYYEFDVTDYVKAQFAGDKVVSFLVKDASNQNKTIAFNSKEKGQNPPQLLIGTVEPVKPGKIAVSPSKMYDNDVSGETPGLDRVITIKNTGLGNLSVSNISLSGTNTDQFVLSGLPSFPAIINPQSSVTFNIAFNPSSTGLKTASVKIDSDDPLSSSVLVPFRGLGTAGLGGSNEPSLQAILDLMEIPVSVGDDDASTGVIHSSSALQKAGLLGEEVSIQKFEKAGTGNVTIEPLAVFGPTNNDPVLGVGWHNSGDVTTKNELFTVSNNPLSNGQTVNANVTGSLSFDPLTASFGFYSRWPFFSNRHLYSEDSLNTFSESIPHHVRVYPYKDQSGVVVPNAYIIAFEEHTSGFDYQDVVFVVKNVKPAPGNPYLAVLPEADAFVRNGTYGGINYGTNSSLVIKGNATAGLSRSSYLKFSLGSVSKIGSAKLRLYGRNTESTSNIIISVNSVDNDSWTETAITFNNAPISSVSAISSGGVNDQAKYYEFDVTDYVKTQFAGDKVVSFLVKDLFNQNKTITFNSKENSQNLPQLLIGTAEVIIPKSNALLFVENPDKFPSNDLFVFSRVQIPWSRDSITYNTNHDSLAVRIHNKGINNLIIKELSLSNNAWQFVKLKGVNYSAALLPLTIIPGTFADLTVKFVAADAGPRVTLLQDTLTIVSNDDKFPSKSVFFSGIWQQEGEGISEPFAREIINSFGFKTKIGFSPTDPDNGDTTKLKGDEILPSYFVRADASLPVVVRQMSSYHGCCTQVEKIMWHVKGSATLTTVFTHIAKDAQSVLPRRGTPNLAAEGSFNPTTAFGFKVGGKDWTDASKNPSGLIGIRIWKAYDSKGNIIPNSYILSNDYLGSEFTNYDYNDNTYFVKNVRPERGSAFYSALNAGSSALDFGEKILQSANTIELNLSSLGLTYADGTKDPALTISAVEITGENKTEFAAAMPVKTTLEPQEATTLTVNFNPVTEGLKIADLMIYYNNSQSPLRVPLYGIAKAAGTTVTALFRVNSGSATVKTINGKTWSDDGTAPNQYSFDNLEPYTNSSLATKIAGTDEDALYFDEQSSNLDLRPFRYQFPVANGNYVVRLYFAEVFWGVPGSTATGLAGGAGSRVMSVTIENQLRLANLDVVQEVGAATALVKNFPVTVTDGQLNINFSATVNRPMVNAVEVYQFSPSIQVIPNFLNLRSFSSDSTNTLAVSSSILAVANTSLLISSSPTISNKTGFIYEKETYGSKNNLGRTKVYPNPLHKRFNIQFPDTYKGNFTIHIVDQLGKVYKIGQFKLKSGESNLEVDISSLFLRTGIYFLRIHSDTRKTEVIKLIVI